MPRVDTALWRDMMDYLRRRHADISRQWFDELTPVALEGGTFTIRTATQIQRDYLHSRCRDQFNEAAQQVTSALVVVRFIYGEEPEEPAAPAEPKAPATVRAAEPPATNPPPPTLTAPLRVPSKRNQPPMSLPGHGDRPSPFESMLISPDFSFENFVQGPSNRLAYAAAVAVANNPGTAYNPLFIHGGVGLGKTHLLQAICQSILHAKPGARICYLSCEQFMNQFLDCVQSNQMQDFRNWYRYMDMVVIDDIHTLAGKEQTQEEFFHTFNALYQAQKQVVLSSDSPPSEIPSLEARLVSRFQWGLVANVTKPCFETRVAICRAKARLRNLEMPDEVVKFIASRVDSNARELEGAITTVSAFAATENRPIDLSLAQAALGEPEVEARHSQVTLQQIIDVVTQAYNVKLNDLQSKRRHKSITEPRQVCMWLARKRTRFSLQEIGGYFGGRDHTTVMHSIRIVDQRAESEAAFAKMLVELDEEIGVAQSGGAASAAP